MQQQQLEHDRHHDRIPRRRAAGTGTATTNCSVLVATVAIEPCVISSGGGEVWSKAGGGGDLKSVGGKGDGNRKGGGWKSGPGGGGSLLKGGGGGGMHF